MIKIKLITESIEEAETGPIVIDPAYHGGRWPGPPTLIKASRGALGVGAYFTPDFDIAKQYAERNGYDEKVENGKVSQCKLRLNKPIILQAKREPGKYDIHDKDAKWKTTAHPYISLLTFLGMKLERAERITEKDEEEKGYPGSQARKLAEAQGYDGVILKSEDGSINQIVIWRNANIIMDAPQKFDK